MLNLDDKKLIEVYELANRSNCNESFLLLLTKEIEQRKRMNLKVVPIAKNNEEPTQSE